MNRWLRYGLVGAAFGALDYAFMELVGRLTRTLYGAPDALQLILGLGMYGIVWLVWLAPLIPLVISEYRHSGRPGLGALAGIIVWLPAMVGYYATYTAYLLLIGAPNMRHLLLGNRGAPDYWLVTGRMLRAVVLEQYIEWSLAAIPLGAIAGWLSARACKALQARRCASTVSRVES